MKYSLAAKFDNDTTSSSGHGSAASALAIVQALRNQGACAIHIFDTRTGRLIDESALQRADVEAQRIERLKVRS